VTRSDEHEIVVLHNVQCWLHRTETWLFNQVQYLPPPTINHVLCQSTDNLEEFPWPAVHTADHWLSGRRMWMRVASLFRPFVERSFIETHAARVDARLLHSHYGYMGWSALDAASSTRLKHVVTFYGLDVTYLPRRLPWWRSRYRRLFQEVDAVLCEGPFMAASIRALGCPPEKVRVHHLGVDVSAIEYRPRRWDGTGPLRILIAATFREKKGIPFAMEALGRLARAVPIEVTVIGEATTERRSRRERRKVMKAIEEQGLRAHVRLLGFQPHSVLLREAYDHHVFLSPSVTARDGDTEGGAPVSIIEMAASGMPVVSTTHCDIPEVLPEGAGLLAPERDVDALFSHLRWLVANPIQWKSITDHARKHVEHEFDASRQGFKLLEIYRDVLGVPPR
jgi:colanic acid/amylovoran biosynthesis glycosyltransferase